jgi:hypothetical protein
VVALTPLPWLFVSLLSAFAPLFSDRVWQQVSRCTLIGSFALSVQLVAKPLCFEHTTTSAEQVAIVKPEKPYLIQSEMFASPGKL